MSEPYTIGRYRGGLALVYYDTAGKRHRFELGTADPAEARRRAPTIYGELTRPRAANVADLWEAYKVDRQGRRIVENMEFSWKALQGRFGHLPADSITIEDCRAHARARRALGIQDGTLCTELGHLRIVLRWAEKRGYLLRAPHIELPPRPKREEHHLTREQIPALLEACQFPHIRVFIALAIGTGGRSEALLGLTWDRVDFGTGLINLKDPSITRPHKGRAIVPMNNFVRRELELAKKVALSDWVVEWAGKRVASVKKALTLVGNRSGVGHVTPHLFRHSAAVHMAEAGIDMEEIAQFLGHSDSNITRRLYARYSPKHLRKAAAALEY
jgi:integrase